MTPAGRTALVAVTDVAARLVIDGAEAGEVVLNERSSPRDTFAGSAVLVATSR